MDVLEALKTIKEYCEKTDCNNCNIKEWCEYNEIPSPNIWRICEAESMEEMKKAKTKTRGFEVVSYAPADIKLPVRSTELSAGYDFFASEDIFIPANGVSKLIKTGIKAYMKANEFLPFFDRSSLATKHGINLVNVPVIDADFYNNADNEGNISLMFRNNSDVDYTIKKGEKMAQAIFMDYLIADGDNATGKRTSGLGSTGK